MYASVYILVLSIVVIGIRGQTFTLLLPAGEECPATSVGWKKLADAKSCPGNAPYHCVINEHGEFGEVCVKESWVQPGFCPEYNTAAKKINVKRCQPFDGFSCSTQAFQSHQTYSHEICLRKPKPTTTTMAPPVTTTAAVSEGSSPAGAIIAVLILLILAIVGFILVWWFYLRKNYNCEIRNPFTGGTITICHKPVEVSKGHKPVGVSKVLLNSVADNPDPETDPLLTGEKQITRSNPYFVETNIYREIIGQLEKNNVVLVVGNTGIGKSATSVGVLEYYRDIKEWKTIYFPLEPMEKVEERTIVLVDVTFGDLSLYSRYDSNIENMMNRLYTSTRECKEFKVLITSSSSLMHCQNNFPILKGCSELNMSYDLSDLKDLYEMYTKPKLTVVNETEDMSEERSTSNQVKDKDNVSEKAKIALNQGDDKPGLANEKDHNEAENPTDVGLNFSDSIRSTKSEEGYPKSSIDLNNLQESAERDDKDTVGEHEQSSTEDTSKGNEEDRNPATDPSIQENEKDGETDPSKVETEITDNHEKSNVEVNEKLEQKAKETPEAPNVSEFGLPIVCYLPGGIEWNVSSSKDSDVMGIFERYVTSLADSENGLDRQKYKTLVYIMLKGSTVDSRFLHKKFLSDIDQDLSHERFLVCAIDLTEIGILNKRGNSYFFNNDLLLFAVIHVVVSRNIRTFLAYCYLPFIMQFLRTESTRSSQHFEIHVDVDWKTLCELAPAMVQRQRRKGDGLQDIELFKILREKLDYHETGTMEFYDVKDKDKTDKKGNIYVRKMVNHYPELKEYYSWAEPEKFQSIKDDYFKSTTKKHPPCSLEMR